MTLDLAMVFDGETAGSQTGGWRLHTAGDPIPASHRIRIDFEVGTPTSSLPATRPLETLPPAATGTPPRPQRVSQAEVVINAEELLETCRQVFGSPGFDNAARAEVFCEAAAGITLEDLDRVLAHCCSGTRPPAEDPIANAHGRIQRVLQSSPLGPIEAASRLRSCLSTAPLETVLSTLQDHWRFGTHWG